MGSFNLIQSHQKIFMKNTNKPRIKNSARENVDLFGQPKEIKKYLVGKPLKSLHGHNHFVSSLALNQDGTKLVSGSWDKTIRLWDVATSKTDAIFKGHTKDILCIGFSRDERLIFSGGMDNTLRYWNTRGDLKYEKTF